MNAPLVCKDYQLPAERVVGRLCPEPQNRCRTVPGVRSNTVHFSDSRAKGGAIHWLWVVLIGLIVGALAKLITPGKDPGGFIVTILLGIAGSIVRTLIWRGVGWYQEGQSAGFIVSMLGALLILAVYHVFRCRAA
jgi:uncharacterized membrane protein YeaQ/YmgE (transglycosylase-associated protein family)